MNFEERLAQADLAGRDLRHGETYQVLLNLIAELQVVYSTLPEWERNRESPGLRRAIEIAERHLAMYYQNNYPQNIVTK